jgi:hypothetical protein
MSGRSVLFLAIILFLIFSLYRVFNPDTSDPEAVVTSYLNSWKSSNGAAIYRLASESARQQLRRHGVHNAIDYQSYFRENRSDLVDWELDARQVGPRTARFEATLTIQSITGSRSNRPAIVFLVAEENGWRIEGWEMNRVYALP